MEALKKHWSNGQRSFVTKVIFLILILDFPVGLPQILGSGHSNTELTLAMREAEDVYIRVT